MDSVEQDSCAISVQETVPTQESTAVQETISTQEPTSAQDTLVAQESNSVQETNPIEEHAHICDDPNHHHDHPHSNVFNVEDLLSSLRIPPNSEQATKQRKRKPNRQQQRTTVAQAIPGNRGNDSIDDLVKFINSSSTTTNEKQSKKKSEKIN